MIQLKPTTILSYARYFLPYVFCIMMFLMVVGLRFVIFSPEDYQQGEYVRIMYIHVPSAWLSLLIYTVIAILSLLTIIYNSTLFFVCASSLAPIGASFAFITLTTGAIWGKPMWGTWWVWDARLTSMLILFLFYLCYLALINAGDNILRAQKPASVISLVGFINVPIVKFSVDLWNSLHQPASVFRIDGPAIHYTMLIPLMSMFMFFLFAALLAFMMKITTSLIKIKSWKYYDSCSK